MFCMCVSTVFVPAHVFSLLFSVIRKCSSPTFSHFRACVDQSRCVCARCADFSQSQALLLSDERAQKIHFRMTEVVLEWNVWRSPAFEGETLYWCFGGNCDISRRVLEVRTSNRYLWILVFLITTPLLLLKCCIFELGVKKFHIKVRDYWCDSHDVCHLFYKITCTISGLLMATPGQDKDLTEEDCLSEDIFAAPTLRSLLLSPNDLSDLNEVKDEEEEVMATREPIPSTSRSTGQNQEVNVRRSTICAVCSVDTGNFNMNYGANSCLSCRAFFRRVIQANKAKTFVCQSQGNCQVIKLLWFCSLP